MTMVNVFKSAEMITDMDESLNRMMLIGIICAYSNANIKHYNIITLSHSIHRIEFRYLRSRNHDVDVEV